MNSMSNTPGYRHTGKVSDHDGRMSRLSTGWFERLLMGSEPHASLMNSTGWGGGRQPDPLRYEE